MDHRQCAAAKVNFIRVIPDATLQWLMILTMRTGVSVQQIIQ